MRSPIIHTVTAMNCITRHLRGLRTYWKEHHTFPSMAKLAPVLGLASASSVFYVINRLTEAGYIKRVERRIAPTTKFFARTPCCRRLWSTVNPAHQAELRNAAVRPQPQRASHRDSAR